MLSNTQPIHLPASSDPHKQILPWVIPAKVKPGPALAHPSLHILGVNVSLS